MSTAYPHDEFAEYDGAYVLGALSVAERAAFEGHLVNCEACRARVAELAVLPDLLALVPASAYAAPKHSTDPVVALLATARARRRKRRWATSAIAAAAAACLVTVTAVLSHGSDGKAPVAQASASASAPAPVAMTVLSAAPIHATIEVTDVAWGTSIRLHCTYEQPMSYPADDEEYSLVVRNRAGQTDNLGTWAIVAGKVTTFPAGTAFHKADIASITVDTADGKPLLQLTY